MPNLNHQESEAKKIPALTESVDTFIKEKKEQHEVKEAEHVEEKAAGVQVEVAEVMEGVEAPKPSEKAGEKKEKKAEPAVGGIAAARDEEERQIRQQIKDYTFPSEEVMVKKVRTAIQYQIKMEWKRARKLKGGLTTGGAQEYSLTIAKIRLLKETLAALFTATFEFIKNLYVKYFTPDGKRRKLEEI